MIHPTAEVEEGAHIGENCNIWHYCHIRRSAHIGDSCSLGRNCYVEGVLGDRVRVQNNVSIYRGVILDDDVFVGPAVVFTNDKYPRAFNREWEIEPTRVHKGASIGAGVVIVCGVTIGRYAMIGAGAVISKSVEPYALVIGEDRVVGRVNEGGFPLCNR